MKKIFSFGGLNFEDCMGLLFQYMCLEQLNFKTALYKYCFRFFVYLSNNILSQN